MPGSGPSSRIASITASTSSARRRSRWSAQRRQRPSGRLTRSSTAFIVREVAVTSGNVNPLEVSLVLSDSDRTASRLLLSSAEHSYDPQVEIDWDAPLADDRFFTPEHRSSLYGTDLWRGLTPQQRITLTRHEVASIAGLGVWF